MEQSNSFDEIIKRILNDTCTDQDLEKISEAIRSGQISIASGQESAAFGGEPGDRIIKTNNNIVITIVNQYNSQKIDAIFKYKTTHEAVKQPERSMPRESIKSLLLNFLPAFLIVVANIIIKRIFPSFDKEFVDLFSYGLLFFFLGAVAFLDKRRVVQKKWQFILTTLITVVVVFTIISVVFFEKPTVYFIVDASENMQSKFSEISPLLKLNATTYPNNMDLGMSVFGGGITGKPDCEDVIQLVPPSSKRDSLSKISEAVDLLVETTPKGQGNLQNAVASAILNLAGRKGLQRITVITSNPSVACEDLDSEYIRTLAEANKVEYQLVILTVGDVPESTKIKLKAYASSEIYINTSTENLSYALETIVNAPTSPYDLYYFGYYGYTTK